MWSRSADWFIFLQTWINLICSYNLKIRTTKGSVQWGYLSLEREINCLSLSEQEIVCKILLRQMHVLYIFKYTFKICLCLTWILFPKDSHKKFWSCYLRSCFQRLKVSPRIKRKPCSQSWITRLCLLTGLGKSMIFQLLASESVSHA